MNKPLNTATILMADDDTDDCLFARELFDEYRVPNELRFVKNGEELLDYLRHKGSFPSQVEDGEVPDLILLDLHMPRKDGFAALKEIKADPVFRKIPVIVLTTSEAKEDIFRSFELEAQSYIFKPLTSEGLDNIQYTLKRRASNMEC